MPRNDTEPYEQLLSEEEVELARKEREACERKDKKRYQRGNYPPSDDRPECQVRDFAPPFPKPSSHPESFVKRFFEFLLATRDPWRLAMGSAVVFLMLNTMASRGWISIPGLSQLAEAQSVTEMRVEQLDGQIESAVRSWCQATTTEGKGWYYSKIKELTSKFQRAAHEMPRTPTCKDLGVRESVVYEQP